MYPVVSSQWFVATDNRRLTTRPEEITKKFIVLDILASDDRENEYDIEMQVRKYASHPERALYYLCKMYSGQLGSGQEYERLKPVVGIHFLDYEIFPENDDFRFRFDLRDVRYPKLRLTDNLSLHIFELPKPGRMDYSDRKEKRLLEWLHFFNHAHEEDDETMRTNYTNPMIHRAYDALKKLSADEETRRLAEMREKALKDEVSMLSAARREGEKKGEKKGRKEGKKEGREDTARNLLSMGILTAEQIAHATDMSVAEVECLRDSERADDSEG
ncbi:Rpn family recombination-promoting nuclease/putative transposase [Desulfobacterales bacterium HSG2]|nr:Rpn family recombination-promoting nuclease/putative transposase [Desulfobacterales bacterium HSG2]